MAKKYIAVAETIKGRKLIPKSENLWNHIKNPDKKDYYTSLYDYTEDHYNLWKKNGSLAGFVGVKTNRLFFDFDSKQDGGVAAQKDAVMVIDKLISNGVSESAIDICFSGNKGFAIEVETENEFTPEELKTFTSHFCEGFSTYDPVIYDSQRIIRVAGTVNLASGLYKFPLTLKQIKNMPMEEIRTLAKSWNNYDETLFPQKIKAKLNSKLLELTKPVKVEPKQSLSDIITMPDNIKKPSKLDQARWLLQNGMFESGERHTAMLCLAATYKNEHGFQPEANANLLEGIARIQAERTNTEPFSREEIDTIIKSVYSSSWKGGQFSLKDPNSWLYKYAQRHGLSTGDGDKPIKMDELGGATFTKYARSYYESRIYTGLADLDRDFPLCAGTNVAIVGAASSGKTSLALDILANSKGQGFVSIFASLDMSKSRLYEKLVYKVTEGKYTREEIFNDYMNGNGAKYDNLVKEAFPNVYIFAKSNPTVEELKQYINDVQEATGKEVRLLMVDYFERLGSDRNDETAASKDVASRIQDLIADFPMLTPITLYQPNKMALGGGPDQPILNYAAIKGSSFVFQSVRQILSLWRPFFNPRDKDMDEFMEMAILKNDLGELGMYCYNWTGKTGEIEMMDIADKLRYDRYISEKKQRDRAEDSDDDDEL